MAASSCHRLAMATALLLALLATLAQVRSAPLDNYNSYSVAESQEVPELRNPAEALLLRRLLDDLRAGQIKYRMARKRACFINSHSCDYKDMVGARDEANYFISPENPGKRRRRSV